MTLNNIEFYITRGGDTVSIDDGKGSRPFTESDHRTINIILAFFEFRYPEAYNAAMEEYSETDSPRFMAASRLVKCNWGENDHVIDIDRNGNANFEHVHCPLRGMCVNENVICCPKPETNLTNQELRIIKLFVDGFQEKEIADKLKRSKATIRTHKENIYRKLGIHNQRELIKEANKLRLT